jgi:GT2 family glycosyltransferase
MQLSIIIVNFKSPELVIQCIESLYSNGFNPQTQEIIVVDNDSDDRSRALIIGKFAQVVYISMGYNSGFARANNAGIAHSKAEAVLLLNSDTIVVENAINQTVQRFLQSDYVGCGVQLLNEDRTPQISGNFAMKGGLNYLLPLPYLGNFLKWVSGLFNIQKPNVPNASGTVVVDWINGAFLMVKKNAIAKAGLLDEEFFLYAEEAEWCSRLKHVGKLCIYGDYNVIHLQGETSKDAFGSETKGYFNLFDKKGLQIMVSNFLRIRKQFGLGWLLFDLCFYIFTIPVFFVGLIIESLVNPKQKKYTFSQWQGYVNNIVLMLPLIWKMIRREKYFYKVL